MTPNRIVAGLVAASAMLCAVSAIRWRSAVPDMVVHRIPLGNIAAGASDSLDDLLADAEGFTVSNDPFRLSNSPSPIRFDVKGDRVQAAGVIVPPRPHLSLKAIIGPPWQAVVDGIPGQPAGTMVKTGARFDKLVARAVTRDSVVMQGLDTTWVLSFGRP